MYILFITIFHLIYNFTKTVTLEDVCLKPDRITLQPGCLSNLFFCFITSAVSAIIGYNLPLLLFGSYVSILVLIISALMLAAVCDILFWSFWLKRSFVGIVHLFSFAFLFSAGVSLILYPVLAYYVATVH